LFEIDVVDSGAVPDTSTRRKDILWGWLSFDTHNKETIFAR